MFGPEGRPQHCCAWLSLACTFSDNAHPNVPDEVQPHLANTVSLMMYSLTEHCHFEPKKGADMWLCTCVEQLPTFARDAVSYAESILDSVMGGLEGLINILDSEGGYGSLDNKVSLCM